MVIKNQKDYFSQTLHIFTVLVHCIKITATLNIIKKKTLGYYLHYHKMGNHNFKITYYSKNAHRSSKERNTGVNEPLNMIYKWRK